MDIRMPELDGLEATRRLVVDEDAPRVLMLTTFDMNEYVYEAMKSGASGFLLKDVRPEQLAEAVRDNRGGRRSARARDHAPADRGVRTPPAARPTTAPAELEELTERELEVVKLIARGLSNDEIAQVAVCEPGDREDPRDAHPRRSWACATASRRSCSPTSAGWCSPAASSRAVPSVLRVCVEGVVHELIGEHVVLTPDGCIGDRAERPGKL